MTRRFPFAFIVALVAALSLASLTLAQSPGAEIDAKNAEQDAALKERAEIDGVIGAEIINAKIRDEAHDAAIAEGAAKDAAQDAALAGLAARIGALEAGTGHGEPTDPPGDIALCTPSGEEHIHEEDKGRAAEMAAVLALVKRPEATAISWRSGDWFAASTWCPGPDGVSRVPGGGARVLVSAGTDVRYAGVSEARLDTVRVDGRLSFAPDADSLMIADTLVSTNGARFEAGTQAAPVMAGKTVEISIAANGPIDVARDPLKFGRGVIWMGETVIHGAPKTPFVKLENEPKAGDRSVTLAVEPKGWRVGDKLVLTGTRLTPSDYAVAGGPRIAETEDEELTLAKIDGRAVTFNEALRFDHPGAADTKDGETRRAYLGNYGRNVRVTGEGGKTVPVQERGHTMVMHATGADIRFAGFFDLGRTDKSQRAFDAHLVAEMTAESNLKARYPFHFHRTGIRDLTNPGAAIGNAVWRSPGWAYTHHDSNAHFEINVAYDCFGACFVSETANETGRWAGNLAVKSIGMARLQKDLEDVIAFDLARTGAGFWMQGRLIKLTGNIAAGVPGGDGYVWMTRGDGMLMLDPAAMELPETVMYRAAEAHPNIPSIALFSGNEALAVHNGANVIKSSPKQGHDNRSVLRDFNAWEVFTGVEAQYTAHYTLIGMDLLATTGAGGAKVQGSAGVKFDIETTEMVVNNVRARGFDAGVRLNKILSTGPTPEGYDWGYTFIDADLSGNKTAVSGADDGDAFLTAADLTPGRLDYIGDMSKVNVSELNGSVAMIVGGEKIDAIGRAPVSPPSDPMKFYRRHQLYGSVVEEGVWRLTDKRWVTLWDQVYSDRASGAIDRVSHIFTWPDGLAPLPGGTPADHGLLDPAAPPPVANDDKADAAPWTFVEIDVLANDKGARLLLDGHTPPRHGEAYEVDGKILYRADYGFAGEDSFDYWARDGAKLSKATVRVRARP